MQKNKNRMQSKQYTYNVKQTHNHTRRLDKNACVNDAQTPDFITLQVATLNIYSIGRKEFR